MPERLSHSFIVKVWIEEAMEEAGQALWRGRIAHVQSGEMRYVQHLDGITAFISDYVERMGASEAERSSLPDACAKRRSRN